MKAPRNLFMFLVVLLCLVQSAQALKSSADSGRARQTSTTVNERAEATAGEAEALLAQSERQNLDNHAVAIQTAQQALALWQTLNDPAGIARAYVQLGRYYYAQNDLAESKQNYERARQLWSDLNNRQEQAASLIMLGFIENRRGEWENSISFLTQARALTVEQDEPVQMGQIASALADIYNQSGLPEQGLFQYERALTYYRLTPDTRDDTMGIWAVGSSYYQLGDYPAALSYLQQALDRAQPGSLDAAISHEFLGRVYISKNEDAVALQHLQSALPIYTKAGNPKEAAQVLALMGQIYQQQGQLKRARQNYEQALNTFRKLSDRINQAAVYYALGRLELKSGNNDTAKNYLSQSIKVTEDMRRVSTNRDLTTAFSASVYERYETYIECLMRQHQAKPSQALDALAFETSELAHARSLSELLRDTQTNLASGLDPQLAEHEKSLRQSLRVKEEYRVALLGREYKREDLDALNEELARLEAEFKQVNESIRSRYPSYEQMTRPVAWDLRRIQEQVIADDQTVLLEYCLGAEKSYVWAVTRSSMTSYELPAQALIKAAAEKVYALLAATPGAETKNKLAQAADELSRMILSPLSAQLSKQRIIIVADGALNYIPFQFLPAPSDKREELVASHEVVNAPSASILGQLRQETERRQTPANLLAAFGDPVFASSYEQFKGADISVPVAPARPLENERWRNDLRVIERNGDSFDPSASESLFFAERELANLRELAAGGESFVATGFEATRERLQSMDLSKFAILHFATHGVLNSVRPENSGLILSTVKHDGQTQDGFVGLQDIYNLHAPVDLVVLSACRTALGKEVRGEGLVGLTRGFMYAGASSVVASLWKADDEATAELMKRFYTNMLQGSMTPAAALRAAQNSIRQEPQWSSPHYWAAFTLQGEYRLKITKPTPAVAASKSPKIILGGVLMALLLSAAWWWWYRRHQAASSARRAAAIIRY